MAAVPNPVLQSIVEALAAHPPFDALASAELRRMAARLRLGYHAKGAVLLGPESGVADRLFIIKQGRVRGGASERPTAADVIPRAERALKPEDWADIEAAFAGNADPIADLRNSDFDTLFRRILALAPAPVGLGESWKRAG